MASIFTRIINGEIPCHKIAEDELHFSFLDINPVAKGHTLVIPKKEIDYIYDLPNELLGSLMQFSQPIARAIDKAFGTIRTGVIVEGLVVPHAHIHLVPIYSEGQKFSLGHGKPADHGELAQIAEAIRAEL